MEPLSLKHELEKITEMTLRNWDFIKKHEETIKDLSYRKYESEAQLRDELFKNLFFSYRCFCEMMILLNKQYGRLCNLTLAEKTRLRREKNEAKNKNKKIEL